MGLVLVCVSSIFIPLEQGLRHIDRALESVVGLFFLDSIRTRIKTISLRNLTQKS